MSNKRKSREKSPPLSSTSSLLLKQMDSYAISFEQNIVKKRRTDSCSFRNDDELFKNKYKHHNSSNESFYRSNKNKDLYYNNNNKNKNVFIDTFNSYEKNYNASTSYHDDTHHHNKTTKPYNDYCDYKSSNDDGYRSKKYKDNQHHHHYHNDNSNIVIEPMDVLMENDNNDNNNNTNKISHNYMMHEKYMNFRDEYNNQNLKSNSVDANSSSKHYLTKEMRFDLRKNGLIPFSLQIKEIKSLIELRKVCGKKINSPIIEPTANIKLNKMNKSLSNNQILADDPKEQLDKHLKHSRTTKKNDLPEIRLNEFVSCNFTLNYDYTFVIDTTHLYAAFLKQFESIVRMIARRFIENFGNNYTYTIKCNKLNNTDKLHSVQLLKRLFFQNDFDKGVVNWYNDYNKAVVNPLLAKVIICQKLATMSPKTWIGSKYGFYYASSKEDSYVGYV